MLSQNDTCYEDMGAIFTGRVIIAYSTGCLGDVQNDELFSSVIFRSTRSSNFLSPETIEEEGLRVYVPSISYFGSSKF